jgi:nitrate reductase gamma subunit
MILRRMWPRPEFAAGFAVSTGIGYVMHVGLFVVVFFCAPHVMFVEGLTGLSWPHLPNTVATVAGAITLAALVAMLAMRIGSPVKRLLSNFDDYFSWFVTAAPVATGLAATAHFGGRYETVLALHILAALLMLAWLPFGKLIHVFTVFLSRGTTGAALARKGASI